LEIIPMSADQITALSEHQRERLLQVALEKLLDNGIELPVDDEESARELLAVFLSQQGGPVHSDDVLRPSVALEAYVRDVLDLLVNDDETALVVWEALDELPEETQMSVDPITAAVVLGALVAFLQTKVNFKISRKDGKVEFEFAVAKKATSERLLSRVIEAIRNVTVR
jgi:hypothetical protein